MVLVFGGNQESFPELIEGVRLVTGEENLIGVPCSRVVANNHFEPNTSIIMMIQSPVCKFSIAGDQIADR